MTAAFPAQNVFHRQCAPKEASLSRSARLVGNPPPISRFSHRDSASGASSPPAMLSHRVARPIDVIRRLFARGREGPRAACRLLQPNRSTTTTGNESFEPRAPRRQSPTDTALPADGYAGPSRTEPPFGSTSLERGQSRGHGPGARDPGAVAPHCLGASHCDRSRRELCPNPISSDTSCRKLAAPQAGVSCHAGASFPMRPLITSLPGARRSRDLRLLDIDPLAANRCPLGPPYAPLREEHRAPPHPRCLPPPEPPR